jgi:predicted RNA binding protein YcfA (HicA-like mRNA interferase family)
MISSLLRNHFQPFTCSFRKFCAALQRKWLRGVKSLNRCLLRRGYGAKEALKWRDAAPTALAAFDQTLLWSRAMKFSELVRLLEQSGFRLVKEKGSIRYYAKAGHPRLIRVDFHGAKEVPTGTCHAILKAAGLRRK